MKKSSKSKQAIIIGGGPAGLTAAYELLQRTDLKPVILEMGDWVGGISATIDYKGNKIDLGGHRFFSKSDRVMKWWLNLMPLQKLDTAEAQTITYQGSHRALSTGEGPDPEKVERVMLLRKRKSRIYFLRQFFDYPLSLNWQTIRQLGFLRMAKIGISYIRYDIFPIRPEKTLEDFFTNRFGRELYLTFFKSYTEKVWGKKCDELSAEWGAQRVKGLSIRKAVWQAVKDIFARDNSLGQKGRETSLIEQFLYPKYGPGQMWDVAAEEIKKQGGEILMGWKVDKLELENHKIVKVETVNVKTGERQSFDPEIVFSTMPITELFSAMGESLSPEEKAAGDGLNYRDFFIVGLLLKDFSRIDKDGRKQALDDNWLYIQEPDVEVGRIQIFNNWSPWLVAESKTTAWIGMEYFCNDVDPLWNTPNDKMIEFAKKELAALDLAKVDDVIDGTVIRVPKAYPVYDEAYGDFGRVIEVLDSILNIYCIGRNGMHKYNNQDHSMLTAMIAVDNIVSGRTDHSNVWEVNTEQEYHEEK